MFDYNPFREVVEEIKKQRTSFVFNTKEDVLKHWNLVPVGEGQYQHATKTGHIFSEDDLEHMVNHGVVPPTPLPERKTDE
jgi:hypothetical protein